ncbi:MAG: RNA polymerase sigma factor [Ruthenibacterium lactatiformans]
MTEQAFEAMVRQYEKLVYTVGCQLVHDHQLAEDLSQETFVSAYLHMESCPPGAEKPWLCRIAVNKAKDHLKSAYNRRMPDRGPRRTAPALAAAQNAPAWRLSAKHAPTPPCAECIEGLAEPYRTVSVLYFAGMARGGHCTAAGPMPKTAHQLYRAKKMLRRELAAVG